MLTPIADSSRDWQDARFVPRALQCGHGSRVPGGHGPNSTAKPGDQSLLQM